MGEVFDGIHGTARRVVGVVVVVVVVGGGGKDRRWGVDDYHIQ